MRTGHATYDSRCETCVKVRGTSRHSHKAVAEAPYFDHGNDQQQSTRFRGEDLGWCWSAWRETFARAVRYGNLPVYCDQEECWGKVVHSAAGRLGMPTGVTVVEPTRMTHIHGRMRKKMLMKSKTTKNIQTGTDESKKNINTTRAETKKKAQKSTNF